MKNRSAPDMSPQKSKRSGFLGIWCADTRGVAALEAGILFPVYLLMLLGLVDLGNAILSSQKTIRASQVTADLIARHRDVGTNDILEAIEAGRLALMPFETGDDYGVDIASVGFDSNGNVCELWRETVNMGANTGAIQSLENFNIPGEGLVIVTVRYVFRPWFGGIVVDDIPMEEVAFVRGRLTATVTRNGQTGCT